MNLHAFNFIVINSSGGKDSQTALRQVVLLADRQQYPRNQIVVVHADLGKMEWPGTQELAREQAAHYGLKFRVVRRRTKDGFEESLLDYVRRRRMWPSSTTRFCTSDFKRDTCAKVIRELGMKTDGPVRILNVFGFRAEESPARKRKLPSAPNNRLRSSKRTVTDWLPIHDWTEAQVWADIKSSGVRYHWAYDRGMPRLSCSFCIFAPRAALMIAGKERPEILAEYVAVEKEIGHDFQHKKPIREIQEALARGEQPDTKQLTGTWNM